jgi:chromosomal replication initiation ATPase DnaA
LRAGQAARLAAPDDELLSRVLLKLFSDRQLYVSVGLVRYLVRRMERSFASAAALVRRLDEAALATGRPVSRQLAAPFLVQADSAEDMDATEAD